MRERVLTYDVVVIGGGLAGAMAAAGAAQKGARVALVAEGSGMTEMSSGCVDLLGATPAGEPVQDPWAALARLTTECPTHPYALLGADAVAEGLAAFRSMAAEMGFCYRESADRRNQTVATALGGLRPTYLTLTTPVEPDPARPVWVVGFHGLKEFHPAVVAAGLQRSLPDQQIAWAWAALPGFGSPESPGEVHPVQAARAMDQPAFRKALIQQLREVLPPGLNPALILLPAVLGVNDPAAVTRELTEALGAEVSEVPMPSPSVPGLRLGSMLWRYLSRHGVELHLGVKILGGGQQDGRVLFAVGQSVAATVQFKARTFVLATGGLLGAGLQPEGRGLVEPIFGLPVVVPDAGQWSAEQLLDAGGHAFVQAGIRTDSSLKPAGWENLLVCGRMLAGYDPYAQACGGGVAIASGWRAGTLAGGV